MNLSGQAVAIGAEVREWRRDLHRYPEIGFEEVRTSGIVADRLRAWGWEVHGGIGRTGVVGVLHGGRGPNGRAIGLRADMDALPMPDGKTVPHRSTVAGKMHGCGHDGHTAMLLGAARILAETRAFNGTVFAIFQPAEEGLGGGKAMVGDGLFERFPIQSVWGLHNWPGLPLGRFAVHGGPVMAGVDYFDLLVRGRGSHAAMPHEGVDPVLVGAHIVTALQSLVSRNAPPWEALTVGVTKMRGADAYHVIPDDAAFSGSLRFFNEELRALAEGNLRRLVDGVAAGFGATVELDYRRNYPPTLNSVAEARVAGEAASAVVGEEATARDLPPSMAAEDFAFMLAERPGCYVWMGQDDREHTGKLHHPSYDFNDAAIPLGITYWLRLVERCLPDE